MSDLIASLPTLTAKGARIALAAAEAEAARHGWRVCIAVVDAAGNLVAFERRDGAPVPSIELAAAKARTAAQFGLPSKVFQTLVDEGQPSALSARGLTPLEGAVPILLDGVVIGAVGASGAAAAEDAAAAQAGAGALTAALEGGR